MTYEKPPIVMRRTATCRLKTSAAGRVTHDNFWRFVMPNTGFAYLFF